MHSDHLALTIELCILVQSNITSDPLTDPSCLILSPAGTYLHLMNQAPKCPSQSFGKKTEEDVFPPGPLLPFGMLPSLWVTSPLPGWGIWHFLAHLLCWGTSLSFLSHSRNFFSLFSVLCFKLGMRCQIP